MFDISKAKQSAPNRKIPSASIRNSVAWPASLGRSLRRLIPFARFFLIGDTSWSRNVFSIHDPSLGGRVDRHRRPTQTKQRSEGISHDDLDAVGGLIGRRIGGIGVSHRYRHASHVMQ